MLEVRILGNQPEPTLVSEGMNIIDFEVRTRDEEIFAVGKDIIEQYVALHPELEGCQLYRKNSTSSANNPLCIADP